MSAGASINNSSINSGPESPKVKFCLDKTKSFISFSKSKSISFDEDPPMQNGNSSHPTYCSDVPEVLSESRDVDSGVVNGCAKEEEEEGRVEKKFVSRSKFVIVSFVDGDSGRIIPLQDAIDRKLVDRKKSTYTDPATGSVVSIGQAAANGKAVVRPLEDGCTAFENRVVDNMVDEIKRNKRIVCRLPSDAFRPDSSDGKETKGSIEPSKVSGRSADFMETPFRLSLSRRPDPGRANPPPTVGQALSKGILTFEDVTYCGEGGKVEVKSVREAATSGLLEMNIYEGLVRIAEERSLENAIRRCPASRDAGAGGGGGKEECAPLDDDDDEDDDDDDCIGDGCDVDDGGGAAAASPRPGSLHRRSINACQSETKPSPKNDASPSQQQQQQQQQQQNSKATPRKKTGSSWLEPLTGMDADAIFVTDLTRCNEVVTLSGWLKNNNKNNKNKKKTTTTTQKTPTEQNNSNNSTGIINNINNRLNKKPESTRTTNVRSAATTTPTTAPPRTPQTTTTTTAMKSRSATTATPPTATTSGAKFKKAPSSISPASRSGSTTSKLGLRSDSKKSTNVVAAGGSSVNGTGSTNSGGSCAAAAASASQSRPASKHPINSRLSGETPSKDGKLSGDPAKNRKDGGVDGKDGKNASSDDVGSNRLGLEAVRTLRRALKRNELSARVSADECIGRTKALRFLTARNIDVDRDLLLTTPRPRQPQSTPRGKDQAPTLPTPLSSAVVSRLPKLKSHASEVKNNSAPNSRATKQPPPPPDDDDAPPKNALTLKEAILTGRLDIGTGCLTCDEGSSFSIYEPAASRGSKFDERLADEILDAVAESSLGNLLRLDDLLPDLDEQSLRELSPISLERSIKEGLLDPTTVFYYDSDAGTMRSLEAAIKSGSFDLKSASFVAADGCKTKLNEALTKGSVKIDFTPGDVQTWLGERKSSSEDNSTNGGNSTVGGKNRALRIKFIDELEKVEKKMAAWREGEEGEFDAKAIEESLRSAGDALILLVNSELNEAKLAGKTGKGGRRNGCSETEDEDLKRRLLEAWREFESIKVNSKNNKTSLETWLKDVEEKLNEVSNPVSLDVEKLSMQIGSISSLKEEAAKRKMQESSLKSNPDAAGKISNLEKAMDARENRLSGLRDCLMDVHSTMDGIDKWTLEVKAEMRKLFGDRKSAENAAATAAVVVARLTEQNAAIRSKKPIVNELKIVVDHFVACAKDNNNKNNNKDNNNSSNNKNNKKRKGSTDSAGKNGQRIQDASLKNCTHLPGARLAEVLYEEEEEEEEEEEGRLRVTNENSIVGVFVDLHANFHNLEDFLAEKAACFALSHFCNASEYLEKAENDIKEVFVASFDPEVLNQQLSDAKSSHEELFSKFSSVQEIAEKLGPIIHSPLDDELGDASNRMSDVCSKFKSVMELSDAKVEKLEEAVSLAVQLKEMQAEVESALMDVESLVEFVEVPTNGNPEEIKNELESSKLAREALLEQLVMVDALVNKSHDLLELLSLEKCQEQLDRPFLEVRQKFDLLNEQLNDKTNGIIQAWRESTTSLADASESFLEELYKISDAIHLTDPISPDVETIRRQINENKALTESLSTCSRSMDHLKRMLVQLHATSMPSDRTGEDQQGICDDLANQLNDLELMHGVAASNVQMRAAKLKDALQAAERYEGRFQQTKSKLLRHIESVDVDFQSRSDSPGGGGGGFEEEEEEEDGDSEEKSELSNDDNRMRLHIQNLMEELSVRTKEVEECRALGGELKRLCEDGAEFKVDRDCSTLVDLVERLKEAIAVKKEELDLGEDLTLKFEELHRNLSSWMNDTEEKLSRLTGSGVASEMRAVKIQIEELKGFMRQLHPHLPDLESINHLAETISAKTTHTSFISRVQVLNEAWNRILRSTNEREAALSEALVEIGELDQTMDDIIGHLQQVEADIQTLDEACGDPKYIEAHLKNIEMLLDNVDNQLPSIRKLNERINTALLKSCPVAPPSSASPSTTADSTPSVTPSGLREMLGGGGGLLPPSKLSSKLRELNETYDAVHCMARQKKNYLIDCLKEVKDFMRTVDDLSGWFTRYCKQLRSIPMPGALPTTVQNEYQKFMKRHQELERKLDESRMLLFNGEEMKLRCREDQAVDLQLGLVKLEAQACDAVIKSKLEKERLEDHMKKVQVFHAAMNHHDSWMGGAERELSAKFKTPSKLLRTVVEQMSQHKEFKEEVSQSQDRVHNLDLTGTYLKYFGSKKDASHVKMQLFGSKSRWKRLVMRTEERGRNLQRAYREDHRFFLSWKELRAWLAGVVEKIKEVDNLPIEQVGTSGDIIKKIQVELPLKQCVLHSTMRQGRHLRDRCTPVDPERRVLDEMIDDIKDAWREACRALNLCEKRHCERLLESRQVSAACRSMEETLVKFVSDLTGRQEAGVRGDLHSVKVTKEQHLAMKEEIESKREGVEKLSSVANVDETTRQRLRGLCDQVERLWQERMEHIEEALTLAQKFNDCLASCCERMTRVELEVEGIPLNPNVNFSKEEKFEVTLEKLKKIEEELEAAEESFTELNLLHRDILTGYGGGGGGSCGGSVVGGGGSGRMHNSSAFGSINHSKSLAEAQLHKLKKSVAHRRRTLEEGLEKTRRDREVLDELLAWISNELAHLALKENNSMPEDLSAADALLKEHLDFHNELTEKKKIVEKFLSSCQSKSKVVGNNGISSNNNNASIVNISSNNGGNNQATTSGRQQVAAATTTSSANPKLVNLSNKWKLIWKVSHDRKRKLQEIFSKLLEARASSSQFNFSKWCGRFSNFVSGRRIDLNEAFQVAAGAGAQKSAFVGRKEFVDAIAAIKFQCKPGDVNAAFDEMDPEKTGKMNIKDFIQKLNLAPRKLRSRPVTDAEQIHRNIEEQLTHCRCHQRYLVNKVSDGKYKFGDKGKMCLVRFLNSMVMVRVGGGWVTLPKYLDGNDPCRTKGRPCGDWKEKFVFADGVCQPRSAYQQKRKSSLTSTVNSGDSSHQLQSPSDSSRSPYCSSSRHRSDNSGSSTPAGRKTPTSSSVRSRTPDFLGNPSPTSSVHSLSSKSHKASDQSVVVAEARNPKGGKPSLGQKGGALQNGTKASLGGSRASVGGASSDGGSPMLKRNSVLRSSRS